MGTFYNIRGTNGSGKTTLARAFLPPSLKGNAQGGPVDLVAYAAPTKSNPRRLKWTEGYVRDNMHVGVVGSYATPTGGLDGIPSFAIQQRSIEHMLGMRVDNVIAEGILCSTVYGSWAEFDEKLSLMGHKTAWVYLHTPVEVCLDRIKMRQAARGVERPIKEDLVRDKFGAIMTTRKKAIAGGRLVYDMPYVSLFSVVEALELIMEGRGELFRAR